MVDVKTIFEPLICGDKSRSTKGGSGLGLAIAKKNYQETWWTTVC